MKMKVSTVLVLVLCGLVLIGIFVGDLWIEMSWIPSATGTPFSLTTMQLIVAVVPVAIGLVIFIVAWFPSIRLRYGRCV